ncbi:bifunctional DNA primase/polymerase [Streptomyces sp. NPDC005438]|uniref:bifunctional DNA primase/polymerase n=1 Tax=Streptomyces sp. NPDC005438 TaxID=3156880 RepID=UPI0033B9BFB3
MDHKRRFPSWLRRRQRGGADQGDAALEGATRERLLLAAVQCGFPLAPAAHPSGYGCSCVRIGCPTPGRHPLSFAWQTQATTEAEQVLRWARNDTAANFITATGRSHDVLDVPLDAGEEALARLEAESVELGPVAQVGEERMLFFTATRGTPEDEDEWWPCELDSHPETMAEHPGLRWHCRGSYVLVPPAGLPQEAKVTWLREPAPETPLPDPLTLLEALTDACAAHVGEDYERDSSPWPVP